MKHHFRLLPLFAVLGACASTPPPPADTALSSTAYQEGVPGSIATESYSTTATVTDVDRSSRQVTLLNSDGSKVAFVAGPEIRNFDQIDVGDHVTATLDVELVISVRRAGAPVREGVVMAQGTAPEGNKPGAISITTTQGSARVLSLDAARREVTLVFSDGGTRTYPVRSDVDMSKVGAGDEVVFRATAAHSIVVSKP
jgi:Cu/Ag efflux protein CusF